MELREEAILCKKNSKILKEIEGIKVPVGYVDISLYRDDLTIVKDLPEVNSVDLGVEIKDKEML